MPITKLAFVFLTALLASLLVLPRVYRICTLLGGIDHPDSERKTHSSAVPRLGGIAIFAGLLVSLLIHGLPYAATAGFLAGATIIFFVGLIDDIQQITPLQKLTGQVVGTTVGVAMSGFHLSSLGDLLGTGEIVLPVLLQVPVTVFCVVGIINAINMIDGLDGLASGVSAIAAGAFVMIALGAGSLMVMMTAAALVGATLGFLTHNTHPARMFMGDSGSNLLGYSLGLLAVGLTAAPERVSPVTPLLVLMLPVIDTLFVMIRRMAEGKSPFSADRTHLHHRLLDLGLGHRGAVLTVYGVSYLIAVCAVFSHGLPDRVLFALFALSVVIVHLGLTLTVRHLFPRLGITDSESSFMTEPFKRFLQNLADLLPATIRTLVIITLLLASLVPASPPPIDGMVALAILVGLVLCAVAEPLNQFVIPLLAAAAVSVVFQMENRTAEHLVGTLDVALVTNTLFGLLALLAGMKIFIRKRLGEIIASPFEHGVFMILLFIPLLPEEIAAEHNLQAVAIKSMILVTCFKLILIRDPPLKNRQVIAATLVSLVVASVRSLL